MSLFKKYSYWIHSGKYTTIQKFSTLAMGIVSFMLLTRMLGPKGFGVWGLFLVISSITEASRMALIKNAFVRFFHQSPESVHKQLEAGALVLMMIVSVLLSLVFLVLSEVIAEFLNAAELSAMLKWYAVTIIVSGLFTHFETLLNAHIDFMGVCWAYLIRQAVLVGLILWAFLFDSSMSPSILAIYYLVSVVIGTLVGGFFCRTYTNWSLFGYRPWLLKLWHYGKFVFGNQICSLLFRSTDTFVASRFFGVAVSGYYNASLRISNLVDMPSQVMGDILFPKAARFNNSDKYAIKNIYEKAVGASLVFSIPALLVILIIPETILRILAGRDFVVAVPVLRIAAFFGFVLPFLKQFGIIMDSTGSPAVNFRVMLFAFGINIVLTLAGAYFLGSIGPVCGTALSYFFIFILTQIILFNRFGISVINIFRNALSFYKEFFLNGKLMLGGNRN